MQTEPDVSLLTPEWADLGVPEEQDEPDDAGLDHFGEVRDAEREDG